LHPFTLAKKRSIFGSGFTSIDPVCVAVVVGQIDVKISFSGIRRRQILLGCDYF